ncbi:hypothetical protein BDQ17DRAFT_1440418 [Cyathus striatus]|nr:hypothetical protein BDQ17DRAFT_1440418 [Cyathus striatus]
MPGEQKHKWSNSNSSSLPTKRQKTFTAQEDREESRETTLEFVRGTAGQVIACIEVYEEPTIKDTQIKNQIIINVYKKVQHDLPEGVILYMSKEGEFHGYVPKPIGEDLPLLPKIQTKFPANIPTSNGTNHFAENGDSKDNDNDDDDDDIEDDDEIKKDRKDGGFSTTEL